VKFICILYDWIEKAIASVVFFLARPMFALCAFPVAAVAGVVKVAVDVY
jgi:hypothetical protein